MPKKKTRLEELQALYPDKFNFPSRKSQEGFGDIEFAADVASRAGPPGYAEGAIDPQRAKYFGTKHSNQMRVLGMTNVGEEPKEFRYEKFDRPYGQGMVHGVLDPQTTSAFGVGARPDIWAHEYRHLQYPGMSEKRNRLYDAYSATDEKEFMDVANIYASYYDIPIEEAIAEIKKELGSPVWKSIAESEYQSGARFGNEENVPPKGLLDAVIDFFLVPKEFENERNYIDQRDQQSWIMRQINKERGR